jgi:hypothetical protein
MLFFLIGDAKRPKEEKFYCVDIFKFLLTNVLLDAIYVAIKVTATMVLLTVGMEWIFSGNKG